MELKMKAIRKIPIHLLLLSVLFVVLPDLLDDFDHFFIDDMVWFSVLFPCFIFSYYLGIFGGIVTGVFVNLYHFFWFFYEREFHRDILIDESITIHIWISLITLSCSIGVGILSEKLKKLNEKLRQVAIYDSLTGLPNRAYFMEKLKKQLLTKEPVALMFIDLDGFKNVNDHYGHEAGDQLLKDVAQKLNLVCDDFTFASRLGGDEFTVLIHGAGVDKTEDKANRIKSMLQMKINDAKISGSIGIAFSNKEDSTSTLLKKADSAMYRAKTAGKNSICSLNKQACESTP